MTGSGIVIKKHLADRGRIIEQESIDKELYLSDSSCIWEMDSGPWREEQTFSDKGEMSFSCEVTKYNYISYEGFMIVRPFITVLYEGKLLRFKDAPEFSRFCNMRFKVRRWDICPICGEEKGPHLRYTFAQGSGLPYNFFVCSKECLRELTHNILEYRRIFKELKMPITHSTENYKNIY